MKINNNSSNIALNTMNTQETEKEKQLKKLSTGLSVSNTDGANQIMFDMLQSNANELLQGVQNGNDAVGYMQTADSTLQSVTNSAQQLNVLSIAMNNGSLNEMDKAALTQQAQGVQASMSDAVNSATYNGNSVFGNTSFSIGSGTISVDITQPNLSSLNVGNQSSITDFLNQTNQTRSNVGSAINQTFAGITNNLSVVNSEKASASQIGDTDIASTVNELNKNILQSNASAYALAHKQDYLAKQASKLLAY